MRTTRFVFLTVSAASSLLAQNTYYLPQVADGIVANGFLKTTLALVNTGKTTATVTIAAFRDDASPRPLTISGLGSNSRFSVKLGPGATRLFVTDGSGDGTAGAAVLSSDVAISVSEVLSNADVTGSLLSESTSPALTDQDLALEYMIPVDATAGLDTGVALYNPGKAAATATLKILDASGQPAGSTTVTIGALGRATFFVRGDLFPGVGDFRGTLDVSSAARLAAVGVRRNQASPAYSLLPAISSASRQLRFFLPQIADGPSGSATLQTTFLLTNLSAKPATVKLSLSGDDGSPSAMNIPGLDANSAISGTIAPGATFFWQTDGASADLTSGAATVRSTQPLAVAAVVMASDANGALLSETTLAPAPIDSQLVMPFDNATTTTAGAVFWNTGGRPVALTVNLTDLDGGKVASAQLAPLAAGARISGMISDFFPGATASSGAITASTGSLINGSVSALALRQTPSGAALSSAPAVRLPFTGAGTPRTLTPTLDTTHQASASIPPSGGTLSVTDAKSNRFTLTIPPGALLNRETITMTAISSATGLSGPGLTAGVQLEPDGLALYQAALLKIELASPAPAGTWPIGWRGQTAGIYLNTPLPDPESLTLVLTHFSGGGVGGFDLTSDLLSIANLMDFYQSLVSAVIAQARQDVLSGRDPSDDLSTADDLEQLWYENVVQAMMDLASGSDDEDVMRCAVTVVLAYSRQLVLRGVGDDEPRVLAMNEWSSYITQRYMQKLRDRCGRHDFTAFYELLAAARQSALMGISDGVSDASAALQSCPPALQLDYTSEINGTISAGVGGTFDATISAKKVMLPGSLTKVSLTEVVDPAKDLYTSFTLSGSGPETYDSISLMVNNVPSGCSVSISRKVPDALTVKTGTDPQLSQVQFKFNPHYQPQALTLRGQQLCSFCPVYRKTPVKVELWVDPGKPSESILSTCPGGATTIPGNFWWAGWIQNHASAGDNGFIQGWDMQADPTFSAEKNISETYVGPAGNFKEKTSLKLTPFTQ